MALTLNGFEGMANEVLPKLIEQSDVFVEWTFEYPGVVALRLDGGELWMIGTANGTWGADLYITDDSFCEGNNPDRSIDSGISADSDDAASIADALYDAMVRA